MNLLLYLLKILFLSICMVLGVINNKTNKKEEVYIEETTTTIHEEETTTEEYVTEEYIVEETIRDVGSYFYIDNVPMIYQNPELPTGCEVTSLTILLNYLGYPIDKCNLADNYLPKGAIGSVTPYQAFLGNPRSASSYGCYNTVIEQTINNYFNSINEHSRTIVNLSGNDIGVIYNEINHNHPVLVWASIGMSKPYYTTTWYIDNEPFSWLANEHCLVLIGYGFNNNLVYMNDPLRGVVSYNKDIFELRYNQFYKQAITIH